MIWLLLGGVLTTVAAADDAPSRPDEKRLAQALERQFQKQAETYAFALDTERKQTLELQSKPLMRWTADGNYGSVWVWTFANRPQIVGCVGSFRNGNDELEGFHEFHAMTSRPIPRVRIGSDYVWEPNQAGPTPLPVEGAAPPAATHRLRLLQMRQLAREFTVEMKSEAKLSQLRLAPTPIYVYEGTGGDVIDGALFSYLWDVGTDPEALLLLESRRTPGGDKWEFVPLRFSWRDLTMKHNDKVVWHVPEKAESRSSRLLRDHYVSCPVGRIDMEALTSEDKDVPNP